MSVKIGVGGAWKAVPAGGWKIGVSSAWKTVAKAWIGVGGAWKEFYVAITALVTTATYESNTVSPTNSRAGVKFDNDGDAYSLDQAVYTSRYTWASSGNAASEYDIYVTQTGDAVSSGTLGSWLNLGTDRVWYLDNASAGSTKTAVLTVQIRDTATTVVLATGTVTLASTKDT